MTTAPATTAPTTPRPRRAGVLAVLAALVVALALAGLVIGSRPVPAADALGALVAPDGSAAHEIVRGLRVPRAVIGLTVGIALGLAGAVMQGITRNPLADPGILGVNAGAALAVVLAIHVLDVRAVGGHVGVALAGAAVGAALVWALGARGPDGPTPVRLALGGAAVTAMLASITTTVLLLDRAALDEFRFWAVGSLAGRPLATVVPALPVLIAGAVAAALIARPLDALELGESTARALGAQPTRTRAIGAAAVVALVGGAVAVAGPIAFVGLVAPHLARPLVGAGHRWLLGATALIGAALVLGGDVVGRVVARPGEVPVGVMTALVGAPVFVALVRRAGGVR